MKNKKGSIGDVFWIAIFLFITAIMFLIGWYMYASVNTQFQAMDAISTQGKTIMADTNSNLTRWGDILFVSLLVGLWLGTIILAFQIESHPIFFPITILVFAVLVIFVAILANTYNDVASTSEFASYADDFTIMSFILNNYVAMK